MGRFRAIRYTIAIGSSPLIDFYAINCRAMEVMKASDALIYISLQPQCKEPLKIDPVMYGRRLLIENFICELKGFRHIAMRADKIDTISQAIIYT